VKENKTKQAEINRDKTSEQGHSAPPNRSLDYSEIHPPAVAVAVAIAGDGDGQLQSGQPTPYPYPALPDRRRNIVDEPAREHRWRREHP